MGETGSRALGRYLMAVDYHFALGGQNKSAF
jgi:hypothetical protein